MEDTGKLSETIRDLLESGRYERLAQVVEEAHAADVAAALRDLPPSEQLTVFRLLHHEQAGLVLSELDDRLLLEISRALDETEISGILDRMQPDDAAQVLDELPEEQQEKVLDLMKEEKSEDVHRVKKI